MKVSILMAVAVLALAGCCLPSSTVEQTRFVVLSVYDGDTFTVVYDGDKTKVRILEIDTPEIRKRGRHGPEEGAIAARDALRGLIDGKVVRLEFREGKPKRDAFGRLLARVYVEGPSGEIDVGRWMLDKGLAERYDR